LRSYGAGKDPQVTLQEQTTIRTRIGAGLATAAEIAAIALLDRIARARTVTLLDAISFLCVAQR
jgi:hypothetical protein